MPGLGDGLIGTNVFGSYVVDIDLPGKLLKLSPLPKRPEDAVALTSLNSEGEEQVNAEQKESSLTEQTPNEQKPSAHRSRGRSEPAPEPLHRAGDGQLD
jgi:hypothetical protein